MEKIGLALAFFIVGGMGVTIGVYIASQIKEHIRSRINNKELIKNLDEKEKTKQQKSKIHGQKPVN